MTKPFVKIAQGFYDDEKFNDLNGDAIGLWVCLISLAGELQCDGVIHRKKLRRLHHFRNLSRTLRILEEANLVVLEVEHVVIPTYTKHQTSSTRIKEKSLKKQASGKKGGRPKAKSNKNQEVRSKKEEVRNNNTPCSPPRGERACDRVHQVWNHYLQYHPNSKLGDSKSDRYQMIKARLSDYAPAELIEAIDGLHVTPFNIGENPDGKKHLGLHLALDSNQRVDKRRETLGEHQEGTLGVDRSKRGDSWTAATRRAQAQLVEEDIADGLLPESAREQFGGRGPPGMVQVIPPQRLMAGGEG